MRKYVISSGARNLVNELILQHQNLNFAEVYSKYNPIERVWGVLENHWNGEILNSVQKTLGLARTMTWNGKEPTVKMLDGNYKTGIKLTKKEMAVYESIIERMPKLEKYFVKISSCNILILG